MPDLIRHPEGCKILDSGLRRNDKITKYLDAKRYCTLNFKEITFQRPKVPFKLGTTSFIYPADWVANARALGRSFDELELLLFESSRADTFPTPATIHTLADLAADLDFNWNVHLPIDIHPGHPDRKIRQQAADTIVKVLDLTAPLSPTTHTLHLTGIAGRSAGPTVAAWLDRISETIDIITKNGFSGKSLTVENIPAYPLELALPVIEANRLEVCLDIGHLLIGGVDIATAFKLFKDRTSLVHLHGVADGKDHHSLDKLPPRTWSALRALLNDYTGTVCLEVFSRERLLASLACLQKGWA